MVGEAGLMIKWPNDLMIGGSKLSGILLERSGDVVVVGIGVNVAVHPALSGTATTSMADHGPAPGCDALLGSLAGQFAAALFSWRRDGLNAVIERWCTLAHPVGTLLRVTLGDDRVVGGRFDGLDETGALLLLLDDGTRQTVHAADVALI